MKPAKKKIRPDKAKPKKRPVTKPKQRRDTPANVDDSIYNKTYKT